MKYDTNLIMLIDSTKYNRLIYYSQLLFDYSGDCKLSALKYNITCRSPSVRPYAPIHRTSVGVLRAPTIPQTLDIY